jgi:hypothetical protein
MMTFRFYSQQWKQKTEDRLQDALAYEAGTKSWCNYLSIKVCCHRSLLSPISLLKIIKSMVRFK